MKSATINLDLTNVQAESSSTFSKVPAGSYFVSLAFSQFKEGKSPEAAGLQIGFMVESGEHKGKLISDYVNIKNPNQQAVEIGLGRLRKICDLQSRTSFKLAKDTDLINRSVFMIDVELVDAEYNGQATQNNKVKKLYAGGVGKATDDTKKEVMPEETITTAKLPWE